MSIKLERLASWTLSFFQYPVPVKVRDPETGEWKETGKMRMSDLSARACQVYLIMCNEAYDIGSTSQDGKALTPALTPKWLTHETLSRDLYKGNPEKTRNIKGYIKQLKDAELLEPTIRTRPGIPQQYRLLLPERLASRPDLCIYLSTTYGLDDRWSHDIAEYLEFGRRQSEERRAGERIKEEAIAGREDGEEFIPFTSNHSY